jgi:uncharacterized protein YfkK (UPF0435 family)
MSSISEVAMDIEELFFVENRTVFEIAEAVNFTVEEVRAYLKTLEQDTLADIEDDADDFEALAELHGFGQEYYTEFD